MYISGDIGQPFAWRTYRRLKILRLSRHDQTSHGMCGSRMGRRRSDVLRRCRNRCWKRMGKCSRCMRVNPNSRGSRNESQWAHGRNIVYYGWFVHVATVGGLRGRKKERGRERDRAIERVVGENTRAFVVCAACVTCVSLRALFHCRSQAQYLHN